MMKSSVAFAAVLFSLVAVSSSFAGDVRIKGVHLCCGACVNDAQGALKGIEGITSAAADRDSKQITFKATDEKAAKAGIEALAKEGFWGTATHDDKAIAFPDSGAKKGDVADIITLTSVHLCCSACVVGVKDAAKEIKGVTDIAVDRAEGTVKVTGKNVDVLEAVAALNKGGFNAIVKKAPAK